MSSYEDGNLAQRVSDLEAKVDHLIKNLQANNGDLYQIVDDWLALSGNPNAEVHKLGVRLKNAIGLRNPPGCPQTGG